jgi:hypothetical protein
LLRQDDYQKTHLVDEGWKYGKEYGGHLAACMVMSCIMNRVKKGWGTLPQVIEKIPNFLAEEYVPDGAMPSIWEPGFVRLLHEVEPIFDTTQDYAKGAVYWADTRRITTPFFVNKILPNKEDHPRIVEMNTFVCFK